MTSSGRTESPVRRPHRWEIAAVAGFLAALVIVVGVAVLRPLSRSGDETSGSYDRPTGQPANPYETQRRAGVQRLLDTWSAALRANDSVALAALFDPHAAPGFLDAEIRRADSLQGVPLADWGFEIGSEPEMPVPPFVADELGASDVWTPPVYLRYSIAGPDVAPTRKPVALTTARRGDAWTLVSDTPAAGRVTWRGPWDFGPIVAETVPAPNGRTSVVLGHPDQQQMVDELAREVGEAIPAVTELWGPDWAGSVLVIVANTDDEFHELAGPRQSPAEVAAVAVSDAVDETAHSVTGQRVVFSPEAAQRLSDTSRRSVLRHELTHVAARASTVDGSRMWMLEGFAEYSGYRNSGSTFAQTAPAVARQVEQHGPPNALPTNADFASPDGTNMAYELGWSACAYVAAEFGEPELVELYRRLAGGPLDATGLDRALQDVIGQSTDDFIMRWGAWMVGKLR